MTQLLIMSRLLLFLKVFCSGIIENTNTKQHVPNKFNLKKHGIILTVRIRDLKKLIFVMEICFLQFFAILPQLPQKILLASKMVKSDLKIIILFCLVWFHETLCRCRISRSYTLFQKKPQIVFFAIIC